MVHIAKYPQISMAIVPPSTPSFKNTCGNAKDPAPQMHLPMFMDADNLLCVPDDSTKETSEDIVSQDSTILSPAKHGSSSVSSSISISITPLLENSTVDEGLSFIGGALM